MTRKKPLVKLPAHVRCFKSHGKLYCYHQKGRRSKNPGPRTRIPYSPDSPEFWAMCRELNGDRKKTTKDFNNLIQSYTESRVFLSLSKSTQDHYRVAFEIFISKIGEMTVSTLKVEHVQILYDRLSATPAKADYTIAALSALIKFGKTRGFGHESHNPCSDIQKIKKKNKTGYAPWPREIADLFYEKCQPHFKGVFISALYSGQRKGDVLKMRWSDIKDGYMLVRQEKTDKELEIFIHPRWKDELETIRSQKIVHPEFIHLSTRGTPWTTQGFSASWRKELARFTEIKDTGLVFHGLRKSAVNSLLEAGATHAQVASITGQSIKMVEHYAAKVNQRILSKKGIEKL